jgi:Flp pilus assembly protein TadB
VKTPTSRLHSEGNGPLAELSPHALRIKARNRARKILLGSEEKSLRQALEAELRRPVRIKLRDKIAFTAGVVLTCATVWILAKHPHIMWIWYASLAVPLLVWRYISYSRQRYQVRFRLRANSSCPLTSIGAVHEF